MGGTHISLKKENSLCKWKILVCHNKIDLCILNDMNDLHVTIEINYIHSFTEDLDLTKEMYAGRGTETQTPHKEMYEIDLGVSPNKFCLMWQDLIKRVRCFTNVK